MKSKILLIPIFLAVFAITNESCKSKKAVVKPQPEPVEAPKTEAPKETKAEPAHEDTTPAPEPAKPDYNFKNIQFEFNSGVLKTDSYPLLDKAAAEMKKDQSVKFLLGGHSSAEGTAEHNMQLSIERANAVKAYLVNAGVNADNLITKGYGESKPLVSNATEEGREQNRRVEIKLDN
ncbi:OmpA family protein [Mucilaginibacter sp. RS28]|uniref:OmpA family protein n=1 Tax=Mucilaginibacter straminoryzae TaxID=2932774 RepID=A0A9X2BBK1_9SPHI|nr:OmpA family protein [Mucilaginibacter straminoryzae]MCJ8211815.1 OmpA family protein [Mucilaginibacter straminoryzae]